MERLGPRMGPVVAQFAYVAKGRDAAEYESGDDFRSRLARFLDDWPVERELAVEVRNAKWVGPPLLDLLRERGVALALPAIYTMPRPSRLFAGDDPVTTDLVYVRFLGHHRRMDDLVARLCAEGKRGAEWSELAVDRTRGTGRVGRAPARTGRRRRPGDGLFQQPLRRLRARFGGAVPADVAGCLTILA